MLVSSIPFVVAQSYLPRWLVSILLLSRFVLAIAQIFFGLGPLGRRFGSKLNDEAIAQAETERDAFRSSAV